MIEEGANAAGFRPFSSSVSAPGTPAIMSEFHSTSDVLASFVTSIFVLGTAVGPVCVCCSIRPQFSPFSFYGFLSTSQGMVTDDFDPRLFAPASEIWGRSIVFHTCNVLFVVFTLACSLSTSLAMLMVFRFLAGLVGAAPLSVGGGTIADIIPAKERGLYIAIFSIGGTIGPVIGPVAGGFLSEAAGWRWTFRLVTIIVRSCLSFFYWLGQESHRFELGGCGNAPFLPPSERDTRPNPFAEESCSTSETNRRPNHSRRGGHHGKDKCGIPAGLNQTGKDYDAKSGCAVSGNVCSNNLIADFTY